jgi:ABC-2 type transport system ATP-binding protein
MQFEIMIDSLRKVYRIPLRKPGMLPALQSLFRPNYNDVLAVDGISLSIRAGEIVGVLGPNGAGKTTTLKMLAGLLYPTAGSIRVAGFTPWERKPEFLKGISMVMGNKAQLTWENTVLDSFYILKEIYGVTRTNFKKRLDELVNLLDISTLLPKLARNLSLGERSKCEFAAALLHHPRILFLDEPTLGLDVSVQIKLRDFIRQYNRTHNTTIILTSHYMTDITSLCKRVVLIHSGKLIFDGELSRLAEKIAPYKLISISTGEGQKQPDFSAMVYKGNGVSIVHRDEHRLVVQVKKEDTSQAVSYIMNTVSVTDLTVEDSPIDAVIDRVYREGAA